MEAVLQPQPRHANLLLHCGAHAVDREIIGTTPTPEPISTWTPVAHRALVKEVEQVLEISGLSFMGQAHSLTHDGLRYFGEIKIARKHTRFILRDLPFLTERAIGRLMERWHHQDQRIIAYKARKLTDSSAHDLIIRSTDVRACTPRQIPAILREWRKHEEFRDRTLWSLFNSFTEVLKGNLNELLKRTEALHGLLDSYVGMHSPSHNEMDEVRHN